MNPAPGVNLQSAVSRFNRPPGVERLRAGRAAQVTDYLNGGNWKLADEFTEVETGERNDRPELKKAVALCRRDKATLIIAKLNRLSRNLAFATLMDPASFLRWTIPTPQSSPLTFWRL